MCRQLRALVTPPNGKCEVTLKLTGSWKLFLLEKGENFFEIFLLHQPLLPKEDVMLILQMRKRSLRKETFQNIFLNVLHARLVNEHWELGKNEKSLKYVECCLQNFEGFGVLSSEGKSISWFLTEQSCEIRMGYTFPKYRGQGHMRQMGCHSIHENGESAAGVACRDPASRISQFRVAEDWGDWKDPWDQKAAQTSGKKRASEGHSAKHGTWEEGLPTPSRRSAAWCVGSVKTLSSAAGVPEKVTASGKKYVGLGDIYGTLVGVAYEVFNREQQRKDARQMPLSWGQHLTSERQVTWRQSPSLALRQVFMKMERAQQALPVEILPPGSHSSELLRTGWIGRTCGIRKQLRPLEKNEPQGGTLPNTGPGRRDSPHPATEAQLGVWVQLRLSAQQVKGPAKMFHLQGPQLLQMLEKSLRKSLPESLKVYGTVFHMNQGNPFNLKALVDKWPDFKTVVIRPQEQVRGQGQTECSQSSLNEVVQNLAATKFVKVEHTQCILYVMPETARKLLPSLPETKNLPVGYGAPKAINQEMFKLSSMDPTHATLVNKFWHFGGNERSQRFIERCIRAFPTFCLLGPEGTPASWSLMDQTGEIRMGATLPEYRGHGLISHMLAVHTRALDQLGIPVYNHTDKANKIVQKVSHNLHHIAIPHGWNQWNCEPL
ncbi:hypothetical protein E5288_WYG007257 [Bos mutus]|uniref:Glycine N-acyltransferase-like protein n=2 Tax=Bos TaxID=9903 RepID=A0A6B0S9Z5_9CETA|nr:hypothetical protein [Bos mutus]